MNNKYRGVPRNLPTREALLWTDIDGEQPLREAYKQRIGWTDKYPGDDGFLEDLIAEIHSTSAVAVASLDPTTTTRTSSSTSQQGTGTRDDPILVTSEEEAKQYPNKWISLDGVVMLSD